MKIQTIWNKIGRQNAGLTAHTDAVVFIHNKPYPITGIRYARGRMIGFNADDPYEQEEDMEKKEEGEERA